MQCRLGEKTDTKVWWVSIGRTVKEICIYCGAKTGYDYFTLDKEEALLQWTKEGFLREIDSALFRVEEIAEYLNIGMTQARELIKAKETVFFKLENRLCV